MVKGLFRIVWPYRPAVWGLTGSLTLLEKFVASRRNPSCQKCRCKHKHFSVWDWEMRYHFVVRMRGDLIRRFYSGDEILHYFDNVKRDRRGNWDWDMRLVKLAKFRFRIHNCQNVQWWVENIQTFSFEIEKWDITLARMRLRENKLWDLPERWNFALFWECEATRSTRKLRLRNENSRFSLRMRNVIGNIYYSAIL